jgi:hypothetical protein
MSSDLEKDQTTQAMNALTKFAKLLVKEYPPVFAGETGTMKIKSSKQYFPLGSFINYQKTEIFLNENRFIIPNLHDLELFCVYTSLFW